ncbi:MAG: SPOR domain-containing protein [bacterium]
MTQQNNNNEKENTINNKSNPDNNKITIISTIVLLLVLIIFFTAYSIYNSGNLSKLNNNYNVYTNNTSQTDESTDTYTYLNEDYKNSIDDRKEEKQEEENYENLTGSIETKDESFLKSDSDNTIGFTETVIKEQEQDSKNAIDISKEDSSDNTVKNTESGKTTTTLKDSSDSDNKKKLNNNITQNKTTEPKNKLKIYKMKAYEKTDIQKDPYISKETPYIIQIATHNNLKSAEQIKDILKLEGYNSYIIKAKLNEIIKYRIRVGAFRTKNTAILERKKLIENSQIIGIENSIILYKLY